MNVVRESSLQLYTVPSFNEHIRRPQQETQESPATADKPARRESMPKNAPIRRAYDVVADNTGLLLLRPKSAKSREIH